MFKFQVTGKLKKFGRTGIITTAHGQIRTPVFMPVGTAAAVKSLSPRDLEDLGAQIILANNYHLFLRPGSKSIRKLGGIHKFMGWNQPVLTDSGGFQVQSLGRPEVSLCRITSAGVEFRSHLDGGTLHLLTPEIATRSQIDIGADIIMAFDDSTPADAGRKRAQIALDHTNHWLTECVKTWKKQTNNQALFGIIQGGSFSGFAPSVS